MIDVVLNFMIAGRDTTAAALSWTTYVQASFVGRGAPPV